MPPNADPTALSARSRRAARLVASALIVTAATAVTPLAPTAVAAAGLDITKSSSADVVESGETFDYRILVSCSSATGDCVDAVVTDVLPPELSGAASDVFLPPVIGVDASYDEPSRTITWTFTNDLDGAAGDVVGLAAGSSVELLASVKFPPGSTPDGTIASNTAVFEADLTGDGNPESTVSNTHPVSSTATFGFNAIKSVRGGVANIGLDVTYDIELCSDPTGGLDMQAGATLRDTLPTGAVFVSATNGGVESPTGVVEWTLPAVAANGTCQVVGSVTVEFPEGTFTDGQVVTNTASVLDPVPLGGDPTSPEPPIDATLNHPVVAPFGEGGAGKSGAQWITPGQPFVYTLTIDSTGFLPITNAVLTDTIPNQIDVTSITIPAGVDRAFYTSDDNATPRSITFTPGVPVTKATLVGTGGDHVASVRLEADSVGAFESLDTIVSAVVIDGGTDRAGGTITEGTTQGTDTATTGTEVVNCTNLTYDDHDGVAQTNGPTCSTTVVKTEFAVPRITKTGNIGPYLPGATVTWEITATNDSAASTSLHDFVISDLVPDEYEDGTPVSLTYVPGSAVVVSKPASAPDPIISDTTTYAGRQLLEWGWTGASSYSLAPGESVTLAYQATLVDPTPPGTIRNHASLSDWTNGPGNSDADRKLAWNCTAPAFTDADLLAYHGVTAANLADPDYVSPPCFDSSPIQVQAITGLESIKWVRGEADLDIVIGSGGSADDPVPEAAGFSRFPATGFTYQGGFVDYRIVLTNPGNVPIDDLVVLDILPRIGDSGVLTGARGSQWRPILVAPVTVPNALVYYTTEEDPCRDARLKIPSGCTDWSLTPPDPISDVTALLFDFDDDFSIPADGEVQFGFELTAPAGTPIDGSIAWNSFGFSSARADTANELLPAEPRKVGIVVRNAPSAVYGDYVWFDFDHDGLQDAEETGPARVDEPSRLTGINGVRVQFYKDEGIAGPSTDDTFVRVTYTQDDFAGNPGFYSFPELDPGSYYAVFDVPTGLDLTLPNEGGDDTVDSDADFDNFTFEGATIIDNGSTVVDQVVVAPTALGLDEIDLTWDVGFWDPASLRSSLGDTVFYDNDTDGLQVGAFDGVAGVTVNLWWVGEDGTKNDGAGDDILLQSDTTDATGQYRFDWLVPGLNYYVEFVEPAAHVITALDTGANDTIDSDADPSTGFTELIDLDNGPDPAAVAWDPDTQTVETQWDAGLHYPNTIGNRIWEDLDRDGVQDSGEPGVNGVTVQLFSPGPNGVIGGGDDIARGVTTTSGGGLYQFTRLPNGAYFVVVDEPAGTWFRSPDSVGADDTVDSDGVAGAGDYAGQHVMTEVTTLQIEPGTDTNLNTVDDLAENDSTWDFGFYRLASIGNRVWEDLDRDGIQDGGEPGVAGVTVQLLDSDGALLATTTTNGSGVYQFTGLQPGTYSVRFDPSTAPTTAARPWFLSPRDQDGDDSIDSDADTTTGETVQTQLVSNENDTTWDAGIWRWASIGDTVWHDQNGNGVQDLGEPGIDGVTVELLDSVGNVVDTTVTATDLIEGAGYYLFDDLDPDDYSIRFVLTSPVLTAGGYVPTGLDDGADDTVDSDADRTTGETIQTQLTSNEDDPTWDAGFYVPVDLGDFVWYDSDLDGVLDATDQDPALPPGSPAGINGVTVRLLDSTGAVIATTTTADDPVGGEPGYYVFPDLRPGTYELEFVLLPGHSFSPSDVGGNDALDSDADPATGRTGSIVLVSGADQFTWDAGMFEYAGLGNFVWDDLNADGVQDSGEPGINGVTVRLLDGAGAQVDTTVTANDPVGGEPGWYTFDFLVPGTYSVTFDRTSPALAGYQGSPQDAGGNDTLDSDADPADGTTSNTVLDLDEFDPTIDAGFFLPASLGDFVWDDLDGDGIQDGGEPGIENVTVWLRNAAGTEIDSTTTNASGFYQFTDLVPGTYSVRFDLTSAALTGPGYVLTPANIGADTADSDAGVGGVSATTTLVSDEDDPTLDAGFYIPVAIGDLVWEDLDGDGFQEVGELGVDGVTVTLVDGTGTDIVTTTTDTDGLYEFTDLPPGSYSVRFDLMTIPVGFRVTLQDADADASDDTDSDADTVTGATPATSFLISGSEDRTLDMGLVIPVIVGDFVWEDLDGDGIQDTGEPGIGGVDVALFRIDPAGGADIPSGTTTTIGSGFYQFVDQLPGEYYVVFDLDTLPAGMVATFADAGGDDAADSDADRTTGVTAATPFLFSDDSDVTLDLGAYTPVTVGDFVWDDLDGDGVQDVGEPGVDGVTVYLRDSTGARVTDGGADLTATTDGTGFYQFTGLPPGAYQVEFDLATLPAGAVVTFRDRGADDTVDSDADVATGLTTLGSAIPSGGDDPDHDMGIFSPVALGDFVWDDLDGDGVQDAGEPGVEGVDVTLFQIDPAGGAPIEIGTDTTDVDGRYLFADLPPGEYYVVFDLATLPPDSVVTFQEQGGDDTVDSDADPLSGQTATTGFLTSGDPDDLSLDMGIITPVALGDFVWDDLDGDGVQDAGEPGVEGVDVTLFQIDPAGGAPIEIGTDTTDVDGRYLFTDLPPGEYYVVFDLATLPPDSVVTFQDQGADDTVDSDADPIGGQTATTLFLTSGDPDDLSLDMGIITPVALGDFVWDDLDGDGVQDAGEPGVEGVDVTLFQIDPAGGAPIEIGTDTTDVDGAYRFADLDPAEYYVVFDVGTLPGSYVPTFADQGGDEALDSDGDPTTGVTRTTGFLPSGSDDVELDLGLYVPVTVGDRVWFDQSGDGIQDVGEPGVEGVTVTLFDVGDDDEPGTSDDVEIGSTVTDPDGSYGFPDLPPDEYFVVFDLTTIPDDRLVTVPDRGADDALDSDADRLTGATPSTGLVPSGANFPDLDLGLVAPVAIGDRVWIDTDADGIQDDGEPGAAGVGVTLWRVGDDGLPGTSDDVAVVSTTTSADGEYLFGGQDPGEYYVVFDLETLPSGHVVTARDTGSDDTVDSDVDPIDGRSSTTGFLDGSGVDTDDLTLDLGIYVPATIGDLIWEDRNGDGVRQAGEPGVAGITVDLIAPGDDGIIGTADDQIVDSVVSDDTGEYLFTGVVPGRFAVAVDLTTLPTGALIAPLDEGSDDTVDSDVDPATGRTTLIDLPFGADDRTWDAGISVPPDLRLTKTAGGALVRGSQAAFRLVVSNVGVGTAYGPVEVVDVLPTGLRFVSATGTGWTCSAAGQTVTCVHVADLAAGASSTLTLTVDVTAATPSSVANEATVSAIGSGTLDPTPLDNTASTGTITVTDPPSVPRTGGDPAGALRLAVLALGLGVLLRGVGRRRSSA